MKTRVSVMKKEKIIKRQISVYPIYAIGIIWLIYAMIFHFYKISDYLIACGLSILLYLFLKTKVFKDEVIEEYREVEELTGNEAYDQALKEANNLIKQLEKANDLIENEIISNYLSKIVEKTEKIFDLLKQTPEKVGTFRKFLSYYLPTTLQLLNTYLEYDKDVEMFAKVQNALKLVDQALTQKQNELVSNQMMDVQADIEVLKTMLNQDGLLDEMKKGN